MLLTRRTDRAPHESHIRAHGGRIGVVAMRAIGAIAPILMIASVACAEDELTPQGMLATAKYAGFCGALTGMSTFQSATKMPGGDAFFERSVRTEAARLGLTPETLVANCKQAIMAYDNMWQALEKR